MITQKELKRKINYDPLTGLFVWRMTKLGTKKDKVAGGTNVQGYIKISINKKRYAAHRLAFLYMTGTIPELDIDHIDRNRTNNKWDNLRIGTRSQNCGNTKTSKRNKSGYKGVRLRKDKTINPWTSQIVINTKLKHLGYFSTAEAAALAYNEAAIIHFGEFANLNKI